MVIVGSDPPPPSMRRVATRGTEDRTRRRRSRTRLLCGQQRRWLGSEVPHTAGKASVEQTKSACPSSSSPRLYSEDAVVRLLMKVQKAGSSSKPTRDVDGWTIAKDHSTEKKALEAVKRARAEEVLKAEAVSRRHR